MQKRGLNLWHRKDLLAPTPSVRQPVFETSEKIGKSGLQGQKKLPYPSSPEKVALSPKIPIFQERTRHINLRKIPGTLARCPWDTRRNTQGSTGRCPDFLLANVEKRTEKGIFAGTPAGCPRNAPPSSPGGFSEILCDFFFLMCLFCSLIFLVVHCGEMGIF